jgi:hypothetical protein
MNTVNVVFVDDVHDRVLDEPACFRDTWVEFQVPSLRLRQAETQRVIARVSTRRPSEPLRPRLRCPRIERVGLGPDLDEHRVDAMALGGVQQLAVLLLLLVRAQPSWLGPVDVVHRRDPQPPQLA